MKTICIMFILIISSTYMWEKVTVYVRVMHPDFIGFITTPLSHYLDKCYIGWITRVLFAGSPSRGFIYI